VLQTEQWMDIHVLYEQLGSIGAVCRETGFARNTVRKSLRLSKPPEFQKPVRATGVDSFKEYLTQRYTQHGLSAERLLAEIRAQGFTGSVYIVRRFLRKLKPLRAAASTATVRFETAPGHQAQCDRDRRRTSRRPAWRRVGHAEGASGWTVEAGAATQAHAATELADDVRSRRRRDGALSLSTLHRSPGDTPDIAGDDAAGDDRSDGAGSNGGGVMSPSNPANIDEAKAADGLDHLGLKTAREHLDGVAQQASTQQWTYTHFLGYLLKGELDECRQRNIEVSLKFAKFPYHKRLDDFDYQAQPSLDRRLI
jgi:IstB-like ATP binding protein